MRDGVKVGARVGVVMLCHERLDRAGQVARHWAEAGAPVVVHLDRRVGAREARVFAQGLSDLPGLAFAPRHACEWGTWGIVAATLDAAALLLARSPEASHVLLASGACLPLRPLAELEAFLAARPGTDFIESAAVADAPWTAGGLSEERFTLRFPFAWRRQRRLFDAAVALQRRLGLRRRPPPGIEPHMGSQWWCLTRPTLAAILRDPRRAEFDRWFARTWVPDESYVQTLARRHAARIESRSLTFARFDAEGRPHVLHDDHLLLLARSNCFVARKAWPGADRLYAAALSPSGLAGRGPADAEPDPAALDHLLAQAAERRRRGRPGLVMQSRLPRTGIGATAAPFAVFEGFAELFEDWEGWLARVTGARVHGHLFAPERARFAGGGATFAGALPAGARLRDHNAPMFLRNLLWATRGETQCFQFGPRDAQHLSWDLARDPNARIAVVTGAWVVPLLHAGAPLGEARIEAARLQRVEAAHLDALRSPQARARLRIWTLADLLDAPEAALREALEGLAPPAALAALPPLVDLQGLGRFLRDLRNAGLHLSHMGEVPADLPAAVPLRAAS